MKLRQHVKTISALLACLIIISACRTDSGPAETGPTPSIPIGQASAPLSSAPANTGVDNKHNEATAGIPAELDPMPETGSLKISTMYEDRYLNEAVLKFKDKYPGWEITVSEYGALNTAQVDDNSVIVSNDPQAEEKYAAELTVELMAGRGPDLISILNLDYKKLGGAGALCDLNSFLQADGEISVDDLHTNVLKAMEYKGKLYTMPMYLMPQVLQCFSKLPDTRPDDKSWTPEEMAEFCAPLVKETGADYLFMMPGYILMGSFFRTNYSYIVDEDNQTCDFTGPLFKKMLEACKSLQDNGLIPSSMDGYVPGMKELFSTSFAHMYITSYDPFYTDLWGGEEHFYLQPNFEGTTGIASVISSQYAINANSKELRGAWEFLKFMVSEEMQVSPEMWATPISKKAMRGAIENVFASSGIEKTDEEMEKYLADWNDFIGRINRIMPSNDILTTVREEVQGFFDGTLTAEETAVKIQEKVTIMLNE